MLPRKIWIGAAVATVIGGTVFFLQLGEEGSPGSAESFDLARGAQAYVEHCASCHGADLKGEPNWRERKPNGRLPAPPHDASGHTWHHPDAVLFKITKQGTAAIAPPGYESDMPGFADILSDAEIRDLLAYIHSRWPAEIRARQAAISTATDG
ncbi:MAG: cytochrome c [Proteobacteria bacterium]|nr:cytochrome c [Pseudomonadota bacterium]